LKIITYVKLARDHHQCRVNGGGNEPKGNANGVDTVFKNPAGKKPSGQQNQ
jgi:hypothetical protein